MSLFYKCIAFFYNNKTRKSFPGVLSLSLCPFRKNQKETPQCTRQKGSITVEASIIIPLYICFFVTILFFFRIMQVQIVVQGELEEVGRKLSVVSMKEVESEILEMEYLGLAKGLLYLELKEEVLIEKYVMGGAIGVNLLASEFDEDYISLNANYLVRFPLKLLGGMDVLIFQNTRFRKWNGWSGADAEVGSEDWVYVTEYGEVYHIRRSCPYLKLTIRNVFATELNTMKNVNGECYDKCERCGAGENRFMVYITDYGNRYHYSLECSGLKRTIYYKKRSEVGEMEACSKCWK